MNNSILPALPVLPAERSLFGEGRQHIDMYLTYRCNLRCRHCFVGPELAKRHDMPWEMFSGIVSKASKLGVRKLTLLGGEPTLYHSILKAVQMGSSLGFEVRLVTNGTESCGRFLDRFVESRRPLMVFSIDGSSAIHHDRIRGNGSFEELRRNVMRARDGGFRVAGISTIGRANLADAANIVMLAEEFGLEYLNIHAISPVGFAYEGDMLDGPTWRVLSEELRDLTSALNLEIRIDARFPHRSYDDSGSTLEGGFCAVREGSEGNAMVLPDGRIFSCALFVGEGSLHSYSWGGDDFLRNMAMPNETSICTTSSTTGCPGMARIQNGCDSRGSRFLCMYRKLIFRNGAEVIRR